MNFKLLFKLLGGFWIGLACILLAPTLYALSINTDTNAFIAVVTICALAGALSWYKNRDAKGDLNIKTSFAFVTFCWLSVCLFGALPYWLSFTLPHFADSFFEACSGFTGTGASVLTNIEATSTPILLWRSMTQWLGGIGIIVFFIVLLPLLGVSSAQAYRAESTGGTNEHASVRITTTARNIWLIYTGFTGMLILILWHFGMNWFDAINHSLTTISTGGFSTRNTGIAAFDSIKIDYAIAFFMLFSSTNFAIHFRLLTGRMAGRSIGAELKYYYFIIAIATLLITFGKTFLASGNDFLASDFTHALRVSFFTVTATASSTGFTNFDYLSFPVFTHIVIVFLMIFGGMSGSTSGGIKCIRLVALINFIKVELKKTLHPRAVMAIKTDSKILTTDTANAIWGLIFVYFLALIFITLALSFEGIDLVSATTASISALSNIGPAFGQFGPFDNFAEITDLSKMILCAGMLLGRLEFLTILVLFTREFWKKY